MFLSVEPAAHRDVTPAGATRHATRVADVLVALLDQPDGLRITDVARRIQVSKSVIHRVLTALMSRDLVRRSGDGRYVLGAAGRALGLAAIRHSTLLAATRPVLRRLHAETRETVTVAARVWDRRVHLAQLLSPHPIRMSVELGRAIPLHAGATGKAILAFAPPDIVDLILTGALDPVTPRTITDAEVLRTELEQVRRDRVATSTGERQPDARSVAAPVLGADGIAIGAVTVCGPAGRFTDELAQQLRPRVRAAGLAVGCPTPGEQQRTAR
jgi:DNA-binding IclR family transcriptional regulator